MNSTTRTSLFILCVIAVLGLGGYLIYDKNKETFSNSKLSSTSVKQKPLLFPGILSSFKDGVINVVYQGTHELVKSIYNTFAVENDNTAPKAFVVASSMIGMVYAFFMPAKLNIILFLSLLFLASSKPKVKEKDEHAIKAVQITFEAIATGIFIVANVKYVFSRIFAKGVKKVTIDPIVWFCSLFGGKKPTMWQRIKQKIESTLIRILGLENLK